MGLITKPFSFTNGVGNNVDATQVNADFDTIYTLVNGNLEAVNIKDSTITGAKLATSYLPIAGGTLTGAVESADHGTATSPQIVSIVYGTGNPPTANTTPVGTLFIKYTA